MFKLLIAGAEVSQESLRPDAKRIVEPSLSTAAARPRTQFKLTTPLFETFLFESIWSIGIIERNLLKSLSLCIKLGKTYQTITEPMTLYY
ncbi:7821_t:CDS:2 [Gigaspora rosea]|nr:7821_t:CDS:2 [Gigaspora rosea]